MICIFESQKVYQIEKLEALDSSNPLSKIILDDKKQNNHIIMDFLGLIYGIVRANSMIIFQASSLAAIDTSIICLNFRNIKKEKLKRI